MAEHGTFPSVMERSYEVPHHMGLQPQDGDKKVEHGTIPSTKAAIGVEHGDICTNISPTPTYEEMPQFPCEESHNPHHLSEMSDSTICEFECTYFEGVSQPPHRESEIVDRSCEATFNTNDLTSTSICVFSFGARSLI